MTGCVCLGQGLVVFVWVKGLVVFVWVNGLVVFVWVKDWLCLFGSEVVVFWVRRTSCVCLGQ